MTAGGERGMWDAVSDILSDTISPRRVENLPIRIVEDGDDAPAAKIKSYDGDETLFLNLDALEQEHELAYYLKSLALGLIKRAYFYRILMMLSNW